MAQNKKEMYYSPEMNVFEVKMEGVICVSSNSNSDVAEMPGYPGGGDPFIILP